MTAKNALVLLNAASMTSLDIAELTKKRHDNVKRTIEDLAAKGIIQLPQIEKVENIQSLSPNSKTTVYVFIGEQGKRDSIIVVAQECPEVTAALVDRWAELEKLVGGATSTPKSKVRTPRGPSASLPSPTLRKKVAIIKLFSTVIPYSETSMVRLLEAAVAEEGLDPKAVVPAYVSEGLTQSLTQILKDRGSRVGVQAANLILESRGLLSKQIRRSSDGTDKQFWVITDEGAQYGVNLKSPKNERETQPHWFAKTADALVEIIEVAHSLNKAVSDVKAKAQDGDII